MSSIYAVCLSWIVCVLVDFVELNLFCWFRLFVFFRSVCLFYVIRLFCLVHLFIIEFSLLDLFI